MIQKIEYHTPLAPETEKDSSTTVVNALACCSAVANLLVVICGVIQAHEEARNYHPGDWPNFGAALIWAALLLVTAGGTVMMAILGIIFGDGDRRSSKLGIAAIGILIVSAAIFFLSSSK